MSVKSEPASLSAGHQLFIAELPPCCLWSQGFVSVLFVFSSRTCGGFHSAKWGIKHHLFVLKLLSIPLSLSLSLSLYLFSSLSLSVFSSVLFLPSQSLSPSFSASLSSSLYSRLALYLTSFLMDGGWLPHSHRQSEGNQWKFNRERAAFGVPCSMRA